MALRKNEIKLLKIFLGVLSEDLSYRGCNDMTKEMKAALTKEEWIRLSKQYHEWNGDPEEHRDDTADQLPDYAVLDYLSTQLTKNG